jgi:hypothetical protein
MTETPFSEEYQFASWSKCGIGPYAMSESTSEVELMLGMGKSHNVTRMKTTLIALTPKKVTLEIEVKAMINGAPSVHRNVKDIPAKHEQKPDSETVSSWKNEDGEGSATVTKTSFADIFKGILWKEGDENVEVGGQAFPCHWIENASTIQGQEHRVKFWLCENIPGGIAKAVIRLKALSDNVHPSSNITTIIVTSFQRN